MDNYKVKVYGKNGKIVSSLNNVGINTAFQTLPYMIEEALMRGEGVGEWDIYGESFGMMTKISISNRIRTKLFHNNLWFDKIANEGEAWIGTIRVRMISA